MDVRRLARDERADLAAFLATLPPRQWQAPTLCAQWRVRDVVAHVVSYDELDARGLLALAVHGRFRSSRINAAALARYRSCSPEQWLALLTAHLQPRGLPAALGGRVALVEAVIHHQDIRRGLGLPRVIPTQRLLVALRWALIGPDIGGLWLSGGAGGRHRSWFCSGSRAGSARRGRGAADGHSRPARRGGRTVRPGLGKLAGRIGG